MHEFDWHERALLFAFVSSPDSGRAGFYDGARKRWDMDREHHNAEVQAARERLKGGDAI